MTHDPIILTIAAVGLALLAEALCFKAWTALDTLAKRQEAEHYAAEAALFAKAAAERARAPCGSLTAAALEQERRALAAAYKRAPANQARAAITPNLESATLRSLRLATGRGA